jgi:hypothetical protein
MSDDLIRNGNNLRAAAKAPLNGALPVRVTARDDLGDLFMTATRLDLLTAALAACLSAAPALAQNRCAVTDPTGTPLNIRETPNGEIIGRVSNGVGIRVINTSSDERGRAWALISPRGRNHVVGWVYREFVSCY